MLQYVATLLLCVDHMHANFLGLRMGSGEFVCIFKLRPLFDCSQNRFVCDASGFCYDSSRRFWAVPASLLPRPERPSCGAVGRPTHLHCGSVLPQVPGGEGVFSAVRSFFRFQIIFLLISIFFQQCLLCTNVPHSCAVQLVRARYVCVCVHMGSNCCTNVLRASL